MANTKLLNLDELSTDEKVIKLDGVEHKMREMTVQEFIDRSVEARKVAASSEKAAAEQDEKALDRMVQMSIDMIHDAFPTITKERLGRLTLNQLSAILDFTVQPPEKIEADVKAAQGNA
jgi:valyl-tRNA synthetase